MGDKEKCYPWPLCYYAWIQVRQNIFFVFFRIYISFCGKLSSRRRRVPWSTGRAEAEKSSTEEETCLRPCSPSQTRQWWDCYWNKKSPFSRNFLEKRKRREIAIICPTFFLQSGKTMFAESPRRKKTPPLSTAAKLASLCKFGKSGGCVRTWSKNRVSPRSPPLYLLIKWIGCRRKKRRRSKIPSFKSRRRLFSFFLPESLCQIGLGVFPRSGLFYCLISLYEKAGKREVVSGADGSSGLKYDLPSPPPPLGDHLRAKMMEYSPTESGKAEHLSSRIFRPVLFLPIKDLFSWKRALKVKWKTLQTQERDKDGLNPDWKRKEERRRRRNGAYGLSNPPASFFLRKR